ncbi:GNAT family N-acetyltransferase [Nocardioides litoris]|uniref:GNAT family N-acetyltransferase n=1 Tax=Nocardioides litoris TaxID=1926648 RepID=UPI0011204BA0|nr:GNAT family protein [Nocardioides litoris]
MTLALDLPLRTERLVLRLARDADVDDLLSYRGDPEVCRYLPFPPQGRDDVVSRMAQWLEAAAAGPDADLDSDWPLTLVADLDGRVVGDVMVRLKAGPARSIAEVGWVFSPTVAGRGLATEAARAAVDLCFGPLGCHRVAAQLDPRNTASARLCDRLGMTHEAHLRQDWWDDGAWTDTAIHAVLRAEWVTPSRR